MGDKATLAKARMELEDMYQGIPDESVNLTFQDFAELQLNRIASSEKKKPNPILLDPISKLKYTTQPSSPSPLTKLPSLDFNRALQASNINHSHHHVDHAGPYGGHVNHHLDHHQMNSHHDLGHDHGMHHGHASRGSHGHNHDQGHGHDGHVINNHHMNSPTGPTCHAGGGLRHGLETSMGAYDHDVSGISMASGVYNRQQDRGGRRRPGIPHSNICTLCSTYIYIFRHRCLVCGRVYCRQCVMLGMGEMTEGRKCVECLGRRFSQRYIQRAGKVGCFSRYPLIVKQAELKWAEKGPRRSGGNNGAYGGSTMMSPRSRSPMAPVTPRTPNTAHNTSSSPNSFVMNSSSYSPYSPTHRHHLPF
ncbi:hypothetical protein PRUPE_6G041100 [Prunus persica]|uniref:FYVE-type domain-containing protein n=1 Tax=Prunus persica TaxID=3760 RepID=M5WSQ5_PRUPE|nr:uncharacterized protein LOC18772159 [Prunus persica]ONH99652.1 hypothetical protein PRUPE_6G041100 [Prunus persica]